MNWAYDLLGVPSDADTATIKRAYARLLRTTRPDEDAAAFQRLNTAYQMALAQAGRLGPRVSLPQSPPGVPPAQAPTAPSRINARPMSPTAPPEAPKPAPPMLPKAPPALETLTPPDPTKSGPASIPAQPSPPEILKPAAAPLRPASAPPPLEVLQPPAPRPTPTIDVAQLARRVIDEACRAEGPLALGNWLAHCPELWSFRIKQITGQLVLQGMAQEARPMQATNFDALLGFFDLNNVLTGLNPVALEQLRNRQTLLWEMQNDASLMTRRLRILDKQGKPDTKRARAYVDILQQPRSWRQTIATALTRGKSLQLARIAHAFCQGNINQLPAPFDKKHALFWLHATGSNGTRHEHWVLVAIRVLAMALACASITAGMMLLVTLLQNGDIPRENWAGIGAISLAAFAGTALFLSALIGIQWVDGWQCLPEAATTLNPWLRRAFIPSLCALALALNYLADTNVAATIITLGLMLLCVRRYLRRAAIRIGLPAFLRRYPILLFYLLAFVASTVVSSVVPFILNGTFPLLATAVTTVVWSLDMWRHRALWRRQQAGS